MQFRFDAVVDVTEVGVEPQNQWDAEASKEPIVVAKTRRPSRPAIAWQGTLGLRILCRVPRVSGSSHCWTSRLSRAVNAGEISETAGLMRGLAKS